MPVEAFRSWGWRLPFLISLIFIALAIMIQPRLEESAEFRDARTAAGRSAGRRPLVEAFRAHPRSIALAAGCYLAINLNNYMMITFVIVYAKTSTGRGLNESGMLVAVLIASAVQLVALPTAGLVSDRFGRRRVFAVGAVLLGLWHSGVSLGVQLSSLLGGAFAPLIATALLSTFGSTAPVAIYSALGCAITSVCGMPLGEQTRSARTNKTPGLDPHANQFGGARHASDERRRIDVVNRPRGDRSGTRSESVVLTGSLGRRPALHRQVGTSRPEDGRDTRGHGRGTDLRRDFSGFESVYRDTFSAPYPAAESTRSAMATCTASTICPSTTPTPRAAAASTARA